MAPRHAASSPEPQGVGPGYKSQYECPRVAVTSRSVANQEDFEVLAMQYAGEIYAHALRLTSDKADAEDLVQETFLKGYRGFPGFESGSNLRAWLYRIATNSYINGYRAKKRRPDMSDIDSMGEWALHQRIGGLEKAASEVTPESIVMESITDAAVKAALDALPDDFKQPVLLADVDGFSYREIAEILDIPIGTVMSRLSRGRKRLEVALFSLAVERGLVEPNPEPESVSV